MLCLAHSDRRRGGRSDRRAALRCAAQSRHGDGGGDISNASWCRYCRLRAKPHRDGERPGASRSHADAVLVNTLSSYSPRFASLPRLAYVNALLIIGTLGTLITPAMLEGWTHLRWTPTQLGAVAAIELAGLAAGSLSGLYWQTGWGWGRGALLFLLVGLKSSVCGWGVGDYVGLCVLRALVGVSGGLLTALYSAVLANSRSPGRIIAVTTFIQIGVEAVFMFSTVSVFERLGSSGLFVLMAGLFIALLPFLTLLPPKWPTAATADSREPRGLQGSLGAYPLLLSFVPFISVQAGVY